jgi:tetratricopeptide (TPR) repeat protein
MDSVALRAMDLDTLLRLASDTYLRSQYDSTKAIIDVVLPRAAELADSSAQAKILTLAGRLARQRSELDTARVLGERALDLKLRIGLEEELWRSYNALGLLAWWEYRLTDAMQLFARAAETWTDGPDSAGLAVNAINRGLVHTDLGDVARARSWFERGLTLTHTMDGGPRRDRLQGIALNNAGMLEIWIGNPAAALSLLDQARGHYRAASFPTGITNALGQLGTAYTALGDLGRAIAVLDSAVALAREYGLPGEESSNLEFLARAHEVSGDYQRALDLYEEADEINRATGDVGASGTNSRNRAEVYQLMKQLDLAVELATEALTAHRSVDARWEECCWRTCSTKQVTISLPGSTWKLPVRSHQKSTRRRLV